MKFYDEIVKYYDFIFPLAEAKVRFVDDLVQQRGISSLLDVGCATGTFCSEIVKHLDYVDGFDLDRAMIESANRSYRHNNLNYVVGDMLKISEVFPGRSYDLITCFGNTLVHLDHEGMLQAFKGIKSRLNKDGVFVGQILNYDYVFDNEVKALPPIGNEYISFDRTYKWDNEEVLTFNAVLTVKETDEFFENAINLYPIRKEVLKKLLHEAGFIQLSFYKNYLGAEAEGYHLPLIFVAE